MNRCLKCGGRMSPHEFQAQFQMTHATDCQCGVRGSTYCVLAAVTVPTCESCKHVDTNSREFEDAFRGVQERYLQEHRMPPGVASATEAE